MFTVPVVTFTAAVALSPCCETVKFSAEDSLIVPETLTESLAPATPIEEGPPIVETPSSPTFCKASPIPADKFSTVMSPPFGSVRTTLWSSWVAITPVCPDIWLIAQTASSAKLSFMTKFPVVTPFTFSRKRALLTPTTSVVALPPVSLKKSCPKISKSPKVAGPSNLSSSLWSVPPSTSVTLNPSSPIMARIFAWKSAAVAAAVKN